MALQLTRALIPYDLAAVREANGRPAFADPYAWHQRSWDCFPDRPHDQRDFLTRIDAKPERLQLLILSPTIPARPDWCPSDGWQTKDVDEEAFFSASRFRFSLLANPTRKIRSNEKGELLRNSRRVPITHREDRTDEHGQTRRGLLTWLADQGQSAGFRFEPEDLHTITRPRQNFVRPKKGDSPRRSGTLHGVDFQGTLEATDRDLLRRAFATGIGPAKAFGFGMLCLAPLS